MTEWENLFPAQDGSRSSAVLVLLEHAKWFLEAQEQVREARFFYATSIGTRRERSCSLVYARAESHLEEVRLEVLTRAEKLLPEVRSYLRTSW